MTEMIEKPSYLSLLEARAASKARPLTRIPLCLDPARYDELTQARQELVEAEKYAPKEIPGKPKAPVKMNSLSRVDKAHRRIKKAEESVQEASIVFVMEGKDADEIKASGLAKGDPFGIILLSLKSVEDLDGNPIPEITPDKIVQLLPTLSAGERALIYTGITMSTSAPDFPTSRR